MQLLEFVTAVYCPAVQLVHAVTPVVSAYLPIAQTVQAVADVEPINCPAGHGRHDDCPVNGL